MTTLNSKCPECVRRYGSSRRHSISVDAKTITSGAVADMWTCSECKTQFSVVIDFREVVATFDPASVRQATAAEAQS